MSSLTQFDSNGNDITCMKEFDSLKYSCRKCDRENCEGREDYEKTKNSK